jgi:phenylacetate-CoA ligase
MSSQQRLALMESVGPTVVCCTPTYALRLAEVAAEERARGLSLDRSGVRVLIVAGEPGGSIPATRQRIERAWGARRDRPPRLTEVGPISFECWEGPGFLHLNEAEFICEVVDPASLEPVPDGTPGELVVTNLGRAASRSFAIAPATWSCGAASRVSAAGRWRGSRAASAGAWTTW